MLRSRTYPFVGFPLSALDKHFTDTDLEYITPAISDLSTHVHVYESAPLDGVAIGEGVILDRLISFRTEQSTAIDCLVFLSQLQRELIALRNNSSP